MNEVVGATGDGDGLQHELEEELVDCPGAYAAKAVSKIILEPVVAGAEAECNFTHDLQKEKRHSKADVVWRAAGAILNNGSETCGAYRAVEEGGQAEG
jgi:hypothetical protein